jgi:cytochrome c-type biogenesis protein
VSGGTVSFAFVAGTVATVNPCGFALLPAYLARRVGVEDGSRGGADAVSRALAVGGVTTAGFMLVFGTIGTAIGLGARELTRALPWAGLVIGVTLVLAGAAVLAGGHLRLRLPQPRRRSTGGGLRGDVLFGIGYGTASLSCTLPIFLAATGSAVTGSLAGSALGFLAYAAGMGTILTALAVAAALSQQGLARVLRRLVPYVNRVGGALLALAGAYVVYYWAFFLWPGSDTRTSGRSLIDRGATLSSRAATWLGSSTGQTTATAVLAALAGLVAWALWRRLFRRAGAGAEARVSPRAAVRPGAGIDSEGRSPEDGDAVALQVNGRATAAGSVKARAAG